MPNWASGAVSVTGRKDSALNFARRFIYEDAQRDLAKPYYFARSFAQDSWGETIEIINNLFDGVPAGTESKLNMDIEFAWSASSCLLFDNSNKIPGSITLSDACIEDNVSVEIKTEESDLGFIENITCGKDGSVTFQTQDMPVYVCPVCGSEYFIKSYMDISEFECMLCEKTGLISKEAD